MLEIKNLTKIYRPKKGQPVKALDNISLKLPKKGMVFILGKSGSGKSTLLNVLGGLDSFTSGEFYIKGNSAKNFKQMDYDSYRNTYIGFIFQEYNILKEFSVGGNIALALELQGKVASNDAINEILKEVDLAGYGARKPNELSGGQMQRVAIARALVKNPDIIMADEPTGALDSATGEAIFATLKKLAKEKLVLVVSHDRDFAERYGDRIIELSDGKIISDVSVVESENEEQKIEANVLIKDNVVAINNGFTLSDEEFLQIKEYIKHYQGPIDLNLSISSIPKKNFKATDEQTITMDASGFKLIKSKLSLKHSFKIGASSLNHKKIKLIFTILLSFIAFTFFGLADTVSSYKLKKTMVNSIIDTKIDYAALTKKVKFQYGDEIYYESKKITEEEISALSEKTKLNLKGVYNNNAFNQLGLSSFYQAIETTNKEQFYDDYFYTSSFSGCLEFNMDDVTKYGYELIKGSKIPDGSKDEIMLTKYEAMYFVGNKLIKYSDNGERINTIDILNIEDLIGQPLFLGSKNYQITAILDTKMDIDRFAILKNGPTTNLDINYYALYLELNSLKEYSLHNLLFVGDGFADRLGISKIDTLTNAQKGTFVIIANGEDEYDYHDYEYISQFTFYDLIKQDATGIYTSCIKEKLEKDEIILADNILLDLSLYKIYRDSSPIMFSTDSYNLHYTINGKEYDLFSFLGLSNNAEIDELLDSLHPYKATYGKTAYALELLMNDYDYYYNEAKKTLDLKDDDIAGLISYIIDLSRIDEEFVLQKQDITKNMMRINAEAIYQIFKALYSEKINITYMPYGEENYDELNLNVVGISYATNYYSQSAAVLSDEVWNKYFIYNPYEVYSFAVGEMDLRKDKVSFLVDMTLDYEAETKYELANNVVDEVLGLKEIFDVLAHVFFYIGLVFALFACLLLSNFIATSISYKKEEIGILRAIGSRSNDVFRIFFSEAFIIAMINFVLACIATLVITIIINYSMRQETALQVTIVSFGIRQIVLLFSLCLLSSFVSSFIPVYKNAKKKPIDAIRNR